MNNLLLEVQDNIAILTINRPKALNALNSETLAELNTCLAELETREDVKVVILTGSGAKSFVAGADISEMVNTLFLHEKGTQLTKMLTVLCVS